MTLAICCWAAAMIAGLWWTRWWTGCFTLLAVIAFVWTQPHLWREGPPWLHLLTIAVSPWLLAAQRERERQEVRVLHTDEAAQTMRLSELARALLSLQRATQQLDRQLAELNDIYRVIKQTSGALHRRQLVEGLLEVVPQLIPATGWRLIDQGDGEMAIIRAARTGAGPWEVAEAREPNRLESAVLAKAQQGAADALGAELVPGDLTTPARMGWAPLRREGRAIGWLIADDLPAEQAKMLAAVANQVALQLARIHFYQQVEALAVTDALTGVAVRGAFLARAADEVERSRRHRLACTVLMVDLDMFKQKNDTYGHLVGDVVLREVAKLLHRNLRGIDMIARMGGEEFAILLTETTLAQAMPIAQRLKELVELHRIRAYDETLAQTISVGMAGFPEHGATVEQLLERADQALYAAKRGGRNRVVAYSERLA